MFGYLKPFKDELKYKNMKEYKRYYCGVCNGLRKFFGIPYTLMLNYEIVFLYLFIDGITESDKFENMQGRCVLNPFFKIDIQIDYRLLEFVCVVNYCLTLLKIKDNYIDEGHLFNKGLYFLLSKKPKYRAKIEKYKDMINAVEAEMDKFSKMEENEENDFDKISDKMGNVLAIIITYYIDSENIATGERRELYKNIGFNLGKWIYLVDAVDDFKEDIKGAKFNPLILLKGFIGEEEGAVVKQGFMMLYLMIRQIKVLNEKIEFMKHKEILANIFNYSLEHEVKTIYMKRYFDEESTILKRRI